MDEIDDDTVQAIREGALPGVRFCRDSWQRELLFEAPETIEEYRSLERREVTRVDEPLADETPAKQKTSSASRRQRKPSLDKLIAKARAAGASSVLVDGVEMRFGEPAQQTNNEPDPWERAMQVKQ